MKYKWLKSYKEVAQVIREYYLYPDKVYQRVMEDLRMQIE
jgi:hypothetical protein